MITSILEYLESSASRYPDKTAFADLDATCTFEELRLRARRVGTALAEHFAPRNPVPVFMEKSVDTIGMFMGAVYAGCFYVLLDTKQPAARISQILDILDSNVIVTSSKYQKDLEKLEFKGTILLTEELEKTPEDSFVLKSIRDQALDTDPLYGIFTSGSTGVPKGVVVGHRSVIDFIDCFTELFHITGEDVMGNQAPWDFDVSVKDIYSGLKTGATVQIIPKQYFSIPKNLLDFLVEREVTTIVWAVSAMCIISTLNGFTYKVPDKIKKVLFSGEVMPIKHLNIWRKYLPDTMFVNIYGPTEITCNCTYYIIDREFAIDDVLPMGKAFPNERVFLLDENDKLIKNSEADKTGEICVSGTAVTMGYFNNKEKTDSAFVQNPLNGSYNEIIYRTGDLGYYNDNKEMCFSSRKDFQIKHNGHRIELGELDMAINSMDNIQRACCIYQQEENKIYAFYEGEQDNKSLTHYLLSKLPKFMIPEVMINVKSMPLTKNGKIDRKALMEEYNA